VSLKILLVSANFYPHVGGIERFTETLASGLAGRGHAVDVVCCRYGGALSRAENDGHVVHRIPSSYVLERRLGVPYPLPSPTALVACLYGRIGAADVVHVQDAIYATSVTALLMAHGRRAPSVLTQHVGLVPQGSRVLDAVERSAIATLGRTARLATLVTSYNASVAAWAAERWGLPGVRVLPVGVPTPPRAESRDELRRSFGLPADRFLALFVGRDVPKKGLDVFLGATGPEYELVAVTDRQRVDGVTRLPFMEHARLQQLLACADAFVLPSEAEGFPLVMQEALVGGLPVVTTPQPGYEHYLEPGDALLVERRPEALRAALRELAADADLRRRLADRARAVGERHFGVDRFVTAYEQLYEEAGAVTRRAPRSSRSVSRTGRPRAPGRR
jgi:glycosyltransferase involved in cell wall biosynthesis